MTPAVFRSKLPLLILIAFTVLCGAWLLSLDPHERFSTDVTELLPANERDPEARLALSLVKDRQARVVLIVLDAQAPQPASEVYAKTLRDSSAFASVELLAGKSWQDTLGRQLHARRFDLLLPTWLGEQRRAYDIAKNADPFPDWLAARATDALDAHLASPESAATADLLRSDPLLLLISLAEKSSTLTSTPIAATDRALIWAETRASPLSEAGQEPVFAALAAAEFAARAVSPEIMVRSTGVACFAASAKASTKAEIGKLNILALVAVLFVSALFIRRMHGLLNLIPPVLISMLGAVTITTLVFPRVHILVFALGSLLSGVAVDYGFQLVLARRDNESYSNRLRRLAVPLLGGSGTTVAGFLVLTFSELPLVRQLGVYVAAGIITGLGATLLYFSLLPRLDLAPRNLPVHHLVSARWRLPIIALLVLLSIVGISRVQWNDDLRTLEFPAPGLRSADAALRSIFGETKSGSTFITSGSSFAEARARWQVLAETAPAGVQLSSIAALFPGPADYTAATSPEGRKELAQFLTTFGTLSESAGFEQSELAPFFNDFAHYLATPSPDYELLMRETLDAMPGPLGLLVHTDEEGVGFLSTTTQSFSVPADTKATLSLSGIEGLNALFARYRSAAAFLSLFGCLVLVLVSCLLHGPRIGLRAASLPLLAAALSFGLMALCGQVFGLFHLLGALLGVCLADDYAHFAHSDDGSGPQARTAIRLSGLTTAASFSILMLSAIPAIFSLGATVTLIVVFALVFVETDLFSLRVHA